MRNMKKLFFIPILFASLSAFGMSATCVSPDQQFSIEFPELEHFQSPTDHSDVHWWLNDTKIIFQGEVIYAHETVDDPHLQYRNFGIHLPPHFDQNHSNSDAYYLDRGDGSFLWKKTPIHVHSFRMNTGDFKTGVAQISFSYKINGIRGSYFSFLSCEIK